MNCDTCPARSRKIRIVKLGNRVAYLCPKCITALKAILAKEGA